MQSFIALICFWIDRQVCREVGDLRLQGGAAAIVLGRFLLPSVPQHSGDQNVIVEEGLAKPA